MKCRNCEIEIEEIPYPEYGPGYTIWAPVGEDYDPCSNEDGQPAAHVPEVRR